MEMANGGSITKRGRNLYEVSCQTGKDEETGKYLRESRRVHGTKSEAIRALDELRHLEKPIVTVPFGEFARQWYESREEEWSPKTRAQYAWLIDRLGRYLGEVDLAAIDARMVDGLYPKMKRDLKWSNTTLKKAHMCLKQIMRQAVDYELIEKNPVERVRAPRNDRVDRRSLSAEEFARLERCLEEARQTPYVLAARIGLATGMRRGEVLGLTWGCVDLARKRIRVAQAQTTHGIAKPKTAAGMRTISINASLASALRRAKPAYAAPDAPVARAKTGGFIDPDHFGRWWRGFAARNGFEGLKFHELRHTQATLLLSGGMDIKTVQARLGHVDASVTLNFYAHSVAENDRRAAEGIEKMLA